MSKTDLLNVKLDIFWNCKSRPFPSLSTQACVEGLAFHPHCGWKFVCISHSCGWQVSGDMLAWALKLSCLSNHMISLIIVQLHPNRMFLQFWSSIAVASHELLGSWVRSQWVTSVFLHSESIICFLSSLSPLLDSDFLLASVRAPEKLTISLCFSIQGPDLSLSFKQTEHTWPVWPRGRSRWTSRCPVC